MENALIKRINNDNLTELSKDVLKKTFAPIFEQVQRVSKEALSVVVTSVQQVSDTALAHSMRMELKGIRVKTEKTRVSLNVEGIRRKNAVDSVAKMIKDTIVPLEVHLLAQEVFISNIKKKEKEDLIIKRKEHLKPYLSNPDDVELYELGDISEEKFQEFLMSQRLSYEVKQENDRVSKEKERLEQEKIAKEKKRLQEENRHLREQKAEADRVAKVKLVAELQRIDAINKANLDALKKVNEKQREEREEQKKKLAEEVRKREKLEVVQRAAKEKLEAESKVKKDAEEAVTFRKKQAAEVLAMAPDREKLNCYADTLNAILIPKITTKEGIVILDAANTRIVLAINILRGNY